MLKPLLFVVALGAGIGLLWPTPRNAPQPATLTVVAAAAPAPAKPEAADSWSAAPAAAPTLVRRSPNGHFYVDAQVNGGLAHFVVDTGATAVALTVDDARRLGVPFSEMDFTTVGRGASGDVRGARVTLDRISVEGKEARSVRAVVVQDLDVSLLGQTYLSRLASVSMAGDEMRLQ